MITSFWTKRTIVSPSVWAFGMGINCTSSPFMWKASCEFPLYVRSGNPGAGVGGGACPLAPGAGRREPIPQGSAGENRGALFAHKFIAARVVAVYVRIDHKFNRRIRDLPDGGHNLVVQGCELGVHHQYPIEI